MIIFVEEWNLIPFVVIKPVTPDVAKFTYHKLSNFQQAIHVERDLPAHPWMFSEDAVTVPHEMWQNLHSSQGYQK